MVQSSTARDPSAGSGQDSAIVALAASEGTAGHEYARGGTLRAGRYATRNLADAIHYLAALHARYPGVIDMAAGRTATPGVGPFLIRAVDGFAVERNYLTKLVVAAGPQPSTPGQAECEAAVVGQRHALEMLAQSDREGCAAGAAIALVLDWRAIREALDIAAARMSVNVIECKLPDAEECAAAAAIIATGPAIERALSFGAQQLLGQHRGLWDLLDARQIARGEY